jgi:hypothetical protein
MDRMLNIWPVVTASKKDFSYVFILYSRVKQFSNLKTVVRWVIHSLFCCNVLANEMLVDLKVS